MNSSNSTTFKMTLLSAAIALVAMETSASGFDMSRANAKNVNIENWQCKSCPSSDGVKSSAYASTGYLSKSDIPQMVVGAGDRQGSQANGGFSYESREKDGSVSATVLGGTGREDAVVRIEKSGDYKVELAYNAQDYVHNLDVTARPPLGYGEQLQPGDISTFDQEKKKTNISLTAEKQLMDGLEGFAELTQKQNSGKGLEANHYFSYAVPGVVATDIDNTTNELKTGLRHSSESGTLQAFYRFSHFENDASATPELAIGHGQTVRVQEPDSTLHQVAASGNYRLGVNDVIQANISYGMLGQDGSMAGGQVADNGQDELGGYIHSFNSRIRWMHRFSSQWRLKTQFNYDNRKNDTDTLTMTDTDDRSFTSHGFTFRTQDYKAELNGRIGKTRVTLGVRDKLQWRPDQNREETDEKSIWLKGRKRLSSNFSLTGQVSYLERDGSDFEAEEKANDAYLADLEQAKADLKLAYNGFDRAGVNARLYYIQDDYNADQSGMDQMNRLGVEMNSTFNLSDSHALYAAASLERDEFDQSLVINKYGGVKQPQIMDQTVDMLGFTLGSEWEGLMDDKLDISIDFSWLQSLDSYSVEEAGDVPDVTYRSTSIEATGDYRYSRAVTLHSLVGYQRISEDDWQLDMDLWTGNKSLDDNGYRVVVGATYIF